MNEHMKIASSTADGKLKITGQVFDHMNWQDIHSLFYRMKGSEYFEARLVYAQYCRQHCDEDEALDIYKDILDETVKNGKPLSEYADIAYQAYCGLSAVTFTGSDYTWESNVGLVDFYRVIFEPNER